MELKSWACLWNGQRLVEVPVCVSVESAPSSLADTLMRVFFEMVQTIVYL